MSRAKQDEQIYREMVRTRWGSGGVVNTKPRPMDELVRETERLKLYPWSTRATDTAPSGRARAGVVRMSLIYTAAIFFCFGVAVGKWLA